MRVVSWNVNGLRAIINKGFKEFIKSYNPDLIFLQETKLLERDLSAEIYEKISEYQIVLNPAQKPGYSGVAVLVKKTFAKTTELEINKLIGDSSFDSEGRLIHLKLKDIDIINIYLPSGTTGELRQNFKYKSLNIFENYLKNYLEKSIICGDFNICHQEIDIHHPKIADKKRLSGFLPEERVWFTKLLSLGLVDTFRELNPNLREYSWWTYRAQARAKNLGWRIDYFLISKNLFQKVNSSKHLNNVLGSDHCPLLLDLD